MVEGNDTDKAERHQKDAEGIVLFTGLFSAALAALIPVSIQDLRPGPQDSLPFSPPRYAIWVNSLWISSLAISITSALLATLIQQWARRYVRITQTLGCAHKRARIRSYIINLNRIDNFHFLMATDGVPALIHLSVFLFFAGLLTLLWNISPIVFDTVVGWVVFCVVVYAYITLLPILRPDSPYYAPVSSLAWYGYAEILYPVLEFLSPGPIKRQLRRICNTEVRRPAARLLKRVEEKVGEIVLDKSPKLDAKILESLLVTLGEDGARERFFEAIPGFYDSEVVHVDGVKENLMKSPDFFHNFRRTVNQFLDQTLSSDSISESVRSRRLLTCLDATHKSLGGIARTSITNRVICSENWIDIPPSPEIGHIIRRWHNNTNSSIALIGSCIIARIIARVEKRDRDDTWMTLARSHLGVTEEILRGYLKHGDSVLLANLIKTTRLFFENGLQFQGILQSISGFNVKDSLPELQHEFCTLWDEIVKKSKHFGDCIFILDEICHVHDALHPTAPTTVATLPTSTTANNDSLLLGYSYALCPDPQSHHHHHHHHPPHASQQVAAVATSSSSSPLGVQPLLPPLQRDETNIDAHLVLDSPSSLDPLSHLRELPVEIETHIPPALGHSYSTTISYPLATPRDVSVSDPDVIAVAGERDVQDLNAHNPRQSDPPARDISMSTSRPGKSVV
ncbi:hypothetical protein F5888DRAFT_1805741 [Russula emetica]|nr:hypothetical protein F5888DRAFT_1805741 [Russula emetica]